MEKIINYTVDGNLNLPLNVLISDNGLDCKIGISRENARSKKNQFDRLIISGIETLLRI